MAVKALLDLLNLSAEGRLFIQTHDFPDPDAIGAAFGLQAFVRALGKEAQLVYVGELQRKALQSMIRDLHMDFRQASKIDFREEDRIILVDGSKGNRNVTDLIGREIAVIDHHDTTAPEDVLYVDIRPQVGACCSMIYEYFVELEVKIPTPVATALLIGLLIDTSQMTRQVSELDLNAFHALHHLADVEYVQKIIRNNIEIKDLDYFQVLIRALDMHERIAFAWLPQNCPQNLLGILADFVLALEEIDFVLLASGNQTWIRFSARSERSEWNAKEILESLLKDIGAAGGHAHMAGGVVARHLFDPPLFRDQLFHALLALSQH